MDRAACSVPAAQAQPLAAAALNAKAALRGLRAQLQQAQLTDGASASGGGASSAPPVAGGNSLSASGAQRQRALAASARLEEGSARLAMGRQQLAQSEVGRSQALAPPPAPRQSAVL